MKRLIICCDGTWNDEDLGVDFTNVVRIARAITAIDERDGTEQIVYYHSGIGVGGDTITHVVEGGTGLGLSRNIRDAYAFIAHNYCAGDEIFLFGFSRGAYTARSVAGLIGWAGVIGKTDMDDFALLWESFKARATPGFDDARRFFGTREAVVPIKCIGVWDTVGALGIPGNLNALFTKLYAFQDTNLGLTVQNAFHALAIDEHRASFVPTLWHRRPEAPATQRLEQVWFAGAHSNVGGGYDAHGLSDVALAWMADRVSPMLGLDVTYLEDRQDRREGWGLGAIVDSAAGLLFTLLGRVDRPVLKGQSTEEAIHPSVATRFAGGAYRPASLSNGVPPAAVSPFGALEGALAWPAADPGHSGGSTRPAPVFTDPLMKQLNI